jgi:endonuclease V-like protein UPF0215 family
MKPQGRVLGIDDAPFRWTDETTDVVGVVVRAPAYIEGVLHDVVRVDGDDALEVLSRMILRSRHREGLSLVLLDGIALAGFNVVDIRALHRRIRVPVATITRKEPDLDAMVRVLERKFPDGARRAALVRRDALHAIETGHKPLYATFAGTDLETLRDALARCTVRGVLPEPLRVAHLIATALRKGESHGRA